MHRTLTSSAVFLILGGLTLVGCYSNPPTLPQVHLPQHIPQLPELRLQPDAPAPMAPGATQVAESPLQSPGDDVAFYDLMQAYGLETSIDLVTGRDDISFEWVKGHAGDVWNDRADALAVEASLTQAALEG